jgi:hypothetical protein
MIRRTRVWLLCLMLCAMAGACAAVSRMGDAAVELKDGQVCFALGAASKSDDVVGVTALSVSGPRGAPRTGFQPPLVWAFWIAKGQPPIALASDTCIPYGTLPNSTEQTAAPQPLKPHAIYSVFLNVRTADRGPTVLGYKAEFCVLMTATGKPEKVLTIPWDERAAKWRYEVCDSKPNQ